MLTKPTIRQGCPTRAQHEAQQHIATIWPLYAEAGITLYA